MKKIRIIGISAFFHDSAVSLIENGEIIYASQEESVFQELSMIQVFLIKH